MKKQLITLFFICLSGIMVVLSCDRAAKEGENRIRVSGEGKIRIMPDQVTLTINTAFTKPRMVDAVRETQATVDTVIALLQKYGNKKEDIKTSSVSANKDYQYIGNTNKFIGYQAQQTIDFVLHDLSKFTELTGKLLETKISGIGSISFDHSKADSILREADLIAYDDALKSAKKLASRADVEIGKLLFLSNDGSASNQSTQFRTGMALETFNKGYGGEGFKVAPEVLEFKRTIYTEFEIR
ncbi:MULTISPECIES: SIMPL domain-containing protein [Sphingobacterium]|uniref:Oxidative stress defense protein n=2 Tax=Sphingobacteriaceae TaxID=84566 RepID=A0A2X2KR56_SPHMU|nr:MULTISPECIES: SIMPL domain-containing protein [Sphingobacterium]HAU52638.1 SIMPL domain-containing protein [Sphingobacterium sp.]QQT45878.1 SIMPL domain-containing protein [Sphingobacterium multivorum]QQT61482.1 SIMPL domain-containing protein [Sphingobacterium multivorum]QRQ63371.1 SIMPL domain-containing protein [Sphingobacterium multivorum]SPZ84629.1 oxidative stress defense protein [Sphingobacterium multivorum]